MLFTANNFPICLNFDEKTVFLTWFIVLINYIQMVKTCFVGDKNGGMFYKSLTKNNGAYNIRVWLSFVVFELIISHILSYILVFGE